MKIYLIRHGQTEANAKGVYLGQSETSLTSKGEQQTAKIIEYLRMVNIDKIYTSPSNRCKIIADAFDAQIPIIVTEGLLEENFGIFEGLTWQQAKELYPEEWKRWCSDFSYKIPDGESFMEFYKRIVNAFNKITEDESHDIAVITHAGPIRAILSHVVCGTHDAFWRFKVDNGSISVIDVVDGYAVIEKFNFDFK
ncbi:alpha-ribazole phosphatase [Caldanaerobius fijiensis DSM 17918]|uniref:Alpha-ribazole phosphatase n=1 Tax=Caldanaerobius fijiensis DSM 17918 TaxID=1121256 RepID=A0A1M4YNY5_9THEO|nr:alpha-ribazole phosphatase [Caldanaerobius fijiensis]SHF07378.1 alpha-ribazole phosphatase [Caldanaerobius fijiensis DSM 17918]